jgi:putative ABC transport system permease protein
LAVLDVIDRDARYALRSLRRTPAFTAIAVATLALAIGANTAIFTVVYQLLIKPLAYREASRLVVIDATRDYEGTPRPGHVSWRLDTAGRWQGSLRAFSDVAFYTSQVFQLSSRNGAELLDGASVSPTFFSTVDGAMVAGRGIATADAAAPSIVISERLARRRFDSPAAAIGAHLELNSVDYVVIGVASATWDLPSWKTDVWESVEFARLRNPQCCAVILLGRLRPGVTIAQARADVSATASGLAIADPKTFQRLHIIVESLRDRQLGDSKTALLLLWAAVGIVLIVASANVVNLLVARNLARGREIAIRHALGASRGRLLAQGLIEASAIAVGGVAGGLIIARAAAGALARVDPEMFPRLQDVHVDPTIVGFAIAVGGVTTVATGLLPSIQAARAAMPRSVRQAPTRVQRRLQRLLCVVQLSAAVVLLVGATLLGRSLGDLLATDLGVTTDHVLTASINTAFGRPHSADELATTLLRVVDQVRRIPGVRAAGIGTSLPPDTSRMSMSLKRKSDSIDYVASAVSCSPGYFQALGIRLLEGRFFSESDDALHAPVIIVSATTARRLFGTDDPIGQTFNVPNFRFRRASGDRATVVGVVSDVKYSGIDATAGDQVYWSLAQAPWLSTFLTIRTEGDVAVASDLRRVVASIDPTITVSSIKPLDGIIATATAPARFRTLLIAAFALVALVIASIGLYGLVAHSVTQRTAEIGVRVALGAGTRDVMSLVLREGLGIAAAGIALGLPAAFVTSRAFAALLFGVKATDPLTYAGAAIALIAVALIASYAPARRACRVDPIVALRAE